MNPRDARIATWVYQPGNGTRYEFTIVRMPYEIDGEGREHYAIVWLRYFGTITLTDGPQGFLHPDYLMDKMNIRAPDAFAVAPAIGWALKNERVAEFTREQIESKGLDWEETPAEFREACVMNVGAWPGRATGRTQGEAAILPKQLREVL